MFPVADARAGRLDFRRCGSFFSAYCFDAPVFLPMLGPLSVPVKERAAPLKKAGVQVAKDDHKLEKIGGGGGVEGGGPANGGGSGAADSGADFDARAEAENSRRMWAIYDQLQQQFQAKGNKHVRTRVVLEGDGKPCTRPLLALIPVLFDGWSYTQTVENLFYFGFLVQRGMAGVVMERGAADGSSPGNPYIALFDADAVHLDAATALRAGYEDGEEEDEEDGTSGGHLAGAGAPALKARRAGAVHKTAAAAQRKAASDVAVQSSQTILHVDRESWALICDTFGMSRRVPGYTPALPHYRSQDSLAPGGFQFAESASAAAAAARLGSGRSSSEGAAGRQAGKGAGTGSKRKTPTTAARGDGGGVEEEGEGGESAASVRAKPAATAARKVAPQPKRARLELEVEEDD